VAKFLLRDARVIIDTIDASSLAHSVEVEKSAEDIDITSYASVSGYKEFLVAERVENFKVAFRVDTAQLLPRSLRDAQAAGNSVFVEVQPTTTSTGAATWPFPSSSVFPSSTLYPSASAAPSGIPVWAANCLVGSLTALDGSAGDAAGSEVELRSTGDVFEYTTNPTIVSPLTFLGPSTVLAS